jgi:transposase
MDFATELACSNLDPAVVLGLTARFEQAQKDAGEVARQRAELLGKDREIRNKELKIQALTLELAHHKRIRFGHKNEAFTPEQRDLFTETWNVDLASIEAEVQQLQPGKPRREFKPTGRRALPPELPRICHRHEPESCTCGQCGRDLVKIGEDVSEQLDVEPARFFVHHHIRPQYACRSCETVTAAPIPPSVIDGGMASPGLHAWVTIQKYLDHLPLYRIEQISSRHGVPIARSTLAEWVGRIGVALQPLAGRLAELLKQGRILHADETPVQQLDPGAGKTRRAYLWAYRSNGLDTGPPMVVFDYQISRSGQHARDFLEGWRGHLMVDDYGGYKALFQQGVVELGCLAHARRKFFDLHAANQHPTATEALARIAELYAIEAAGRELDSRARQALREQGARPKLRALHDWLIAQRLKAAPGSGLAKAIDYSLKRWPALVRYVEDGTCPIDNNPIENAIRPICLGKKNWLFAGSERAGKRAAAIQSLLATATLNGVEPYAWLRDTLEKLPTWPNSRVDELLPLRAVAAA